MPVYQHYGLFFSADQVETAQKNRDQEPFHSAWALLDNPPASNSDALNSMLISALRYRLNHDLKAGHDALGELQSGVGLDTGRQPAIPGLMRCVTLAQVFELVRDHPDFIQEARNTWLAHFSQHIEQLNQHDVQPDSLVAYLWLGLVNLSAGIVLEIDPLFEAGTQAYRQTIDQEIRPEGYLPHAVEGEDGGSMERQLLAVAALTLIAEAASHTGVDLWSYSSRGISVITANLYCIYYYYYPEQWRWDTMTEAQAIPLYRELGGSFELLNRHSRMNDLKFMFEALRPFYNPQVGGVTTLTHGVAGRRKLFGS